MELYGSFDTENLASSDTSDKVLSVLSNNNLSSNVIPLLMCFQAETSLDRIKKIKQFDNVPIQFHQIYPKQKRWDSYQYLLQSSLNDGIYLAVQGAVSTLIMQFEIGNKTSQAQEKGQQYKNVVFNWINLQHSFKFVGTFHKEKMDNIFFFVARKRKYTFAVPFERMIGYKKQRISWLSAISYCKQSNSSLPKLFSRDALDELLFLLKESSDLLTITTMFIDLRVKFSHMM